MAPYSSQLRNTLSLIIAIHTKLLRNDYSINDLPSAADSTQHTDISNKVRERGFEILLLVPLFLVKILLEVPLLFLGGGSHGGDSSSAHYLHFPLPILVSQDLTFHLIFPYPYPI
jgi:hypothetical protein